jgi:hypothetical protein
MSQINRYVVLNKSTLFGKRARISTGRVGKYRLRASLGRRMRLMGGETALKGET